MKMITVSKCKYCQENPERVGCFDPGCGPVIEEIENEDEWINVKDGLPYRMDKGIEYLWLHIVNFPGGDTVAMGYRTGTNFYIEGIKYPIEPEDFWV